MAPDERRWSTSPLDIPAVRRPRRRTGPTTEDWIITMGAVLPEAKGGVFEVPCRALPDPDVFFETAPESVELARAVCAPCPLRTACFEGARQRGEPCGVWGGEQFDNGRVIRKAGRRRRRRLAA